MKLTSRSLLLQTAVIALALCFCASAYAETPREQLVHAYVLLKKADHDYDGHRVAAMKEIESAGKELGLKLEGDDTDKERQWKSDERVTEARRLVLIAHVKLETKDRERVEDRLVKAIKELNAALKVK
jgi:hypothetical protein